MHTDTEIRVEDAQEERHRNLGISRVFSSKKEGEIKERGASVFAMIRERGTTPERQG